MLVRVYGLLCRVIARDDSFPTCNFHTSYYGKSVTPNKHSAFNKNQDGPHVKNDERSSKKPMQS
jgi:hypothetical protein